MRASGSLRPSMILYWECSKCPPTCSAACASPTLPLELARTRVAAVVPASACASRRASRSALAATWPSSAASAAAPDSTRSLTAPTRSSRACAEENTATGCGNPCTASAPACSKACSSLQQSVVRCSTARPPRPLWPPPRSPTLSSSADACGVMVRALTATLLSSAAGVASPPAAAMAAATASARPPCTPSMRRLQRSSPSPATPCTSARRSSRVWTSLQSRAGRGGEGLQRGKEGGGGSMWSTNGRVPYMLPTTTPAR